MDIKRERKKNIGASFGSWLPEKGMRSGRGRPRASP
jgi:hypothetical protein